MPSLEKLVLSDKRELWPARRSSPLFVTKPNMELKIHQGLDLVKLTYEIDRAQGVSRSKRKTTRILRPQEVLLRQVISITVADANSNNKHRSYFGVTWATRMDFSASGLVKVSQRLCQYVSTPYQLQIEHNVVRL